MLILAQNMTKPTTSAGSFILSSTSAVATRSSATSAGSSTSSAAQQTTTSAPATTLSTSTATSSPAAATSTSSSYFTLAATYDSTNFFDKFDFFNDTDPTHGTVVYVDQSTAEADGLISTADDIVTIKMDDTTTLASGVGRNSVRVTSKETISVGTLLVLDAEKIPYGEGLWPAFWTVGDDWPNDIVEQVDNNNTNQMTLHTKTGCTLYEPMEAVGTVLNTNCSAYFDGNAGCGVKDSSASTFGSAFEAVGGGVFATYWSEEGVSIWSFARDEIPADLTSDSPDVSSWGEPKAFWSSTTCSMDEYFGPQTIVINITVCGDWAGATYSQFYSGTCADAVMDPENYTNAEWKIKYVKIYKAK
ncbi:family 16 glycoside hydrolase [Pseudohyphozyma bogoriensis]|nr:family 16 glycoside hydrolase [Pseudohyphozyma bogoriensis]